MMNRKTKKQVACTGFTLVEMLIVLMIIALVGMIAVPRVADTVRAIRFDTISNQLLNDLRFARRSAMDLNTIIEVNFTGGVDYTVTVKETGRQLRARTYPESGAGWTITLGGVIPNPFYFNSRGLPQDVGGSPVGGNVTITGGSGQNRVFTIFAATGMIH